MLSVAIASGLLGLLLGYFLGQGSSIGLFQTPSPSSASAGKKSWPNSYDVKVHADSSDEEGDGKGPGSDDDEEEEDDDAVLVNSINGFEDSKEEAKLMLAVRTDLGMTKGNTIWPFFNYLMQY